ncbi:hypothetical protein ABBQ38_011346 [Trebouxia sp. C0009 RCD-2024]
MLKTSSWHAIPADVLQRAFELQPEGLANCGAASSCVAWRNVARISRVNHLHLHADSDRQEQLWPWLLAARKCIDTLKLERTVDRVIESHVDLLACRSDIVAEASIRSIPTACRSLSLDEFAAYGLEKYIAKCPEVQQLSIQWNGLRAAFNVVFPIPCFGALQQLTELTIYMRNDFDGDSFPCLIRSCPDSVERLILGGFGSAVEHEQPPLCAVRDLMSLEDHLPALTSLELSDCVITIPGEDITCLRKLRSLSLCRSEVYVDGQLEVTLLTKLTCLDLTEATCYWDDAWVEALDIFTAWPALAVLKIMSCNLFDIHTVMDVSHVGEVHMGHFEVFVQPALDQQGHVHITDDQASRYGSMRFSSIVDLHVDVSHGPASIDPLLYVVAAYPLKSLNLHFRESFPHQARPVLDSNSFTGGSFSNLKHLAITGIHPLTHKLHLQSLTCLTSLVLKKLDRSWQVKRLELPCSLEAFTFLGLGLFFSRTEHNLHQLPLLTKVVLEIDEPVIEGPGDSCDFEPGPCVPQLPQSLHYLMLTGVAWCRSDCNWSGLQACLDLQHLTLPAGHQISGPLREWIGSARCLFVVDHVQHEDCSGRSCCRMAQLDEVPGWHLP